MAVLSARDLAYMVETFIRRRGTGAGSPAVKVTENTDLLAQGWLDSVGFIELMLFLEKESGHKIDLTTVEEFTTISGLWGAMTGEGRERSAGVP